MDVEAEWTNQKKKKKKIKSSAQNIALDKLLINKMWRFVAVPPLYRGEHQDFFSPHF